MMLEEGVVWWYYDYICIFWWLCKHFTLIYDYGGLTHFKCLESFLFLQSFVINHRTRGIRPDELCIIRAHSIKVRQYITFFFFTSEIRRNTSLTNNSALWEFSYPACTYPSTPCPQHTAAGCSTHADGCWHDSRWPPPPLLWHPSTSQQLLDHPTLKVMNKWSDVGKTPEILCALLRLLVFHAPLLLPPLPSHSPLVRFKGVDRSTSPPSRGENISQSPRSSVLACSLPLLPPLWHLFTHCLSM